MSGHVQILGPLATNWQTSPEHQHRGATDTPDGGPLSSPVIVDGIYSAVADVGDTDKPWLKLVSSGSTRNGLSVTRGLDSGDRMQLAAHGVNSDIILDLAHKGDRYVLANEVKFKRRSTWHRRQMSLYTDPNTNASCIGIGTNAGTLSGGTIANVNTTRPWLTHIVSAGTNGGVITPNFKVVHRDWKADMSCAVLTHSNIADTRIWVGMFSANPDGAADPNTTHVAAFRYDTGVDGTAFWRIYTAAGAGASTVTATGANITTNAEYDMRIEMDSGEVRFYIDDVGVGTHSTNLPGASTDLGAGVRINHIGASASKRIYWSYIDLHCEH